MMYDRTTDENFNPLPARLYAEPEQRIKEMDRYGIDVQVLSFPNPGADRFGKQLSVKLCRLLNEEISGMAEKHPDSFTGFASVPFCSPVDAVDEIRRAVRDLGLRGVMTYNNINGEYLDSERFVPIFEAASSLGVPVYVHPSIPPTAKVTGTEHNLNMLFGWPFDTSISMTRVAYSGLLDRLPGLKMIFSHAGGMVSFFSSRISTLHEAHTSELTGEKFDRSPVENLKKMYVDLAVYGYAPAIKCTLDYFSVGNCLFASDYPFGPKGGLGLVELATETMSSIDIPPDDKRRIFSDNAGVLLKL